MRRSGMQHDLLWTCDGSSYGCYVCKNFRAIDGASMAFDDKKCLLSTHWQVLSTRSCRLRQGCTDLRRRCSAAMVFSVLHVHAGTADITSLELSPSAGLQTARAKLHACRTPSCELAMQKRIQVVPQPHSRKSARELGKNDLRACSGKFGWQRVSFWGASVLS